jgi:cytochrome c551
MYFKLSSLLLILMMTLIFSACGNDKAAVSSATPEPTAISATIIPTAEATATPDSAVAEALFKQSCTSCHGVDLGGDFGPNLQKIGGQLTKNQIINQIMNGGDNMPGFKDRLKANEIQALATWLAAKK